MTHGADHLNTYRPVLAPFVRSGAATEKLSDTSEIFTAIVQPIFNEKCVQCHNQQKVKGGLLLTTKTEIQKGGDTGPFLQAGDVEKSLFLHRVNMPIEEKEHMPPRGKVQLDSDEIKLLEWWVTAGASFHKRLADVELPSAIQSILERRNERPEGIYALEIAPPNAKKLNALQEEGIRIKRLAQNSPFIQLDLSNKKKIDKEILNKLKSFSKQIIDLDLTGCQLDDKVMTAVARLSHLTRLHLQKSSITDKELKKIRKLKYLEYLNLYGTKITDEGLAHLKSLKGLKTLYLWQTNVSLDGIQQLKSALPELQITGESGTDIFAEVQLNPPQVMIAKRRTIFDDTLSFKLRNAFKGAEIYYTLNGEKPDTNDLKYQDSIMLNATADFKAITVKKGWAESDIAEKTFVKVNHIAKKVSWNKAPSPDYPGKGTQSLSDLKRGGNYLKSGGWMGWQGSHVTILLDYGKLIDINKIMLGYMENTNAWVFAPKGLKVWTSTDGKNYKSILNKSYKVPEEPSAVNVAFLSEAIDPVKARYLKVKVENVLKNPDWHLSPGDKSWLFIDEIIVQ